MPDHDPQQSPQGGPGMPPPSRRGLFTRNPILIIALILAVVILVSVMFNDGLAKELPFSKFYDYLKDMPVAERSEDGTPKKVAESKPGTILEVTIGDREITGTLIPKKGADAQDWEKQLNEKGVLRFKTLRLEKEESVAQGLIELLHSRSIPFTVKHEREWAALLIWILPVVLMLLLFGMMFRSSRMTGENVLSFGRSRAKIVGEDKTGVNFEDVAGADEAKEELSEIVEFLKEPDRFTVLGGKIPKGCLLVGPPGCGKTLLARAVAGEAGVPFFSISGSDFVEMFVGVGAARVRDLFNTAKQKAPCIIFVDEIDAVGRHRGTGMGGGHDEREQTLNQLLVEMDGFDGRKGVIVIAATNRPDILDPALLRPGRFDRNVVLDPPDVRGRHAVLKIHSRGKPLSSDVSLEEVAKRTPGFSGADLANVMNEAALLAARRERSDISMEEVLEAIERVIAGPERRSRVIGPKEKKIIAYHELGHALVARFSDVENRVRKITIIPRGRGALGYTMTIPEEDRHIHTKEDMLSRMRVLLGGRSAEEVIFEHKSSGASDDLQRVTAMARSIVCRLGMSDTLGPVAYDREPRSPFLGRGQDEVDIISEKTAAEIDREVRALIHACHAEALEIIRQNRGLLEKLAQTLLEKETLEGDEFEELVQAHAETPLPPLGDSFVFDVVPPKAP